MGRHRDPESSHPFPQSLAVTWKPIGWPQANALNTGRDSHALLSASRPIEDTANASAQSHSGVATAAGNSYPWRGRLRGPGYRFA